MYIHTYAYSKTGSDTRAHTFVCTCVSVRICVCACAYMCVCAYVCVYIGSEAGSDTSEHETATSGNPENAQWLQTSSRKGP